MEQESSFAYCLKIIFVFNYTVLVMHYQPAKDQFLTFDIDSINKSVVCELAIIYMVVIDELSSLCNHLLH